MIFYIFWHEFWVIYFRKIRRYLRFNKYFITFTVIKHPKCHNKSKSSEMQSNSAKERRIRSPSTCANSSQNSSESKGRSLRKSAERSSNRSAPSNSEAKRKELSFSLPRWWVCLSSNHWGRSPTPTNGGETKPTTFPWWKWFWTIWVTTPMAIPFRMCSTTVKCYHRTGHFSTKQWQSSPTSHTPENCCSSKPTRTQREGNVWRNWESALWEVSNRTLKRVTSLSSKRMKYLSKWGNNKDTVIVIWFPEMILVT